MINKLLTILALAACGFTSLQATDAKPVEAPLEETVSQQLACKRRPKKDLTPGALVCNRQESQCYGDKDQNEGNHEAPSAQFFSAFGDDKQDEENLLACKNCK